VSKPSWIRFLGWLSLFLLIVPLAWPLSERLTDHAFAKSNLPGYMWAAFVPIFLFWLIASAISGIVRYSARMKAKAAEHILQRAVSAANARSADPHTFEKGVQPQWRTPTIPPSPPQKRP
jgi:type VI protein secretion system component VasK